MDCIEQPKYCCLTVNYFNTFLYLYSVKTYKNQFNQDNKHFNLVSESSCCCSVADVQFTAEIA